MSLVSDFNLYYSGSWVGYRLDCGRVIPFYVYEVLGDVDDHQVGSENELTFNGIILDDERHITVRETLGSGRLVLGLPELGYVQIVNSWKWLSYRPVHMANKGLSGRRVIGHSLNNNTAKSIYKAVHVQPDNLSRQFHRTTGFLNYKGREVGSNNPDGSISLYPEWKHLVLYIQKVFTTTTVEVLNVNQ